jgi:error-prone DNA polymerase
VGDPNAPAVIRDLIMPESPNEKLHTHPRQTRQQAGAKSGVDEARARSPSRTSTRGNPFPPYAELHCLTNFSFLRGASHPEELVARAAELGYAALAITDRNSLAGIVRAHLAAREHGLHLLIGAEITPVDAPPLVLIAPDRSAYARLSRLITRGRLRMPKGKCAIYLQDIADLAVGLIALVLPGRTHASSCHSAGVPTKSGRPSNLASPRNRGQIPRFARDDERSSLFRASAPPSLRPSVPPSLRDSPDPSLPRSLVPFLVYREIFTDNLYLAAELAYDLPDETRLAQLVELSQRTGIPLVAANNVHYHVPERRYLQDVLTCIRARCTLAEAGARLFANVTGRPKTSRV